MTKIEVEILRDAASRPSGIKLKGLKVDYEYYPTGAVSKIILSGRRVSRARLLEILNIIYPRDVTVSIRGSAWYDRNPKPIVDSYLGVPVPHTAALRLEYTVPAEKQAMVEIIALQVRRDTQATTEKISHSYCLFIPKERDGKRILSARMINNTLDEKVRDTLGSTMTMFEADKLEFYTADLAVDGKCEFFCAYKLTEFDA